MRRHPLRPLVAALILAAVLHGVGVAAAQTPPTTAAGPVTTTPPTTAAGAVTTTAPSTAATTTVPSSALPTAPPATTATQDGDGDIPWVPIAIGAGVLVVLVAIVALLARRRGAAQRAAADWRRDAADATAEAGATARLLSQGTQPSGEIAQRLLASLRAFDSLGRGAPDASAAATADRARRAIQALGRAIDRDHQLRRAQPPADPQQIARSRELVRSAAAEADRTLRGVYRTLTGAS